MEKYDFTYLEHLVTFFIKFSPGFINIYYDNHEMIKRYFNKKEWRYKRKIKLILTLVAIKFNLI